MPQVRQVSAAAAPIEFAAADVSREFEFSDADFRSLAQLAYQHAGIALSDSKRNLVYGRLSRRLRTLGLTSFRNTATTLPTARTRARS